MAIVNADKPVTTGSGNDQKTIAAGRQLAAGLTQPDPSDQTPLSWELVDAADAADGLENGGYYAVLTIPEGFSAAVNSVSGNDPKAAELQLVSNDASSSAVAALAQLAVDQAGATLGDQVTSGYTDNTLQSFTSIHSSLTSSAKSAHQLADSAHQLADSSDSLADSSDSLADGADSLASGAKQLATGAAESDQGAAQVASGARQLSAATSRLQNGAQETATGADRIATAAGQVASGNAVLENRTDALASGLSRLNRLSTRTAQGSVRVADEARSLAESCPARILGLRYCAEVRRLAAATRIESVAVRGVNVGVRAEVRRADRLALGADAVTQVSRTVARGAAGVATGADGVSDGATALERAARSLSSGATEAATGADSVADGAAANAKGASSLDSGAQQLASGAKQLASGAKQLASGADSMASGLDNGAKSVPSYTDDQRKQITGVVTTPVTVKATAEHSSSVAAGITPAVLGLALWLGALMMFLTRGAVPSGAAWDQAAAGRRVLLGWISAALVGFAQAGLLLVLVKVIGISVAHPVGLALFCGLGVLSFVAVNQALVSLFGGVGRLVSLVFFAVAAASLGGLVPIQTAPAFLQLLNGVLPLPRFVDGASQLLLGGSSRGLVDACVLLALWMAGSLVVSVLAIARRRPRLSTTPAAEQFAPAGPAQVPSTA